VEGIYNPMKRLPKPVREKINRVQTETNKAFDAAWGLAKKMFDANGKAGTVFLDPYVRDPASRFTALSAQAAGEAMRLLEEDERIAEQRADSTQDRDGRLPRPWENGWASAVEGLTERQARAYRWLVAQQTSESEIALDVRASGEHATIVAIAPAADPTWRGDMSDVIEDIFKRHWFFLISQQTCLAALPEEQVRATARSMNCVFTDLPDLLSEAENFFL
jgi:hypothetical protein